MKIIHAELAADPEFRARFSVEVAAARKVSGLFTALVADADVDAQVPWLATAYVNGPSLSEAVRDRGPLSAASLLALAAGLAKSLSAIHAAGVVHGDLKPSNVLLALDGPRVIDFGISQAAEAAPLARSGLVVGTPSFMSPEQAAGQAVGSRSDVFSLGAVLAFAATGRRPFGSGQAAAVLERVVRGAPDLRGAPPEVLPLIERCLAKDPARRPAAGLLGEVTAVQAALALRQPAAGAGLRRPRRSCRPDRSRRPARPCRPATAGGRRSRGGGGGRWSPRPPSRAFSLAGAAGGYGLNAATGHQASPSSFAEAAGKPRAGDRIDAGDAGTVRPRSHAFRRRAAAADHRCLHLPARGDGLLRASTIPIPVTTRPASASSASTNRTCPGRSSRSPAPGPGVVEAGIISYPLNQGCGTGQEYTSSVKAWIYDKAGARSKPVVIHLACTTLTLSGGSRA